MVVFGLVITQLDTSNKGEAWLWHFLRAFHLLRPVRPPCVAGHEQLRRRRYSYLYAPPPTPPGRGPPSAWESPPDASEVSRPEENPARIVEQKMALEAIQHALERLDEIQREVIILRFLLGYSLKEVADLVESSGT